MADEKSIEAAMNFVMDFFAAEWGGTRGISKPEAMAVVSGVIAALEKTCSPIHDPNNPRRD